MEHHSTFLLPYGRREPTTQNYPQRGGAGGVEFPTPNFSLISENIPFYLEFYNPSFSHSVTPLSFPAGEMCFVSPFLLISLFNTAVLYNTKPKLRCRVNSSHCLWGSSDYRTPRDGGKVFLELWSNSDSIRIFTHDCHLLSKELEPLTLNKNYTCIIWRSLKS